MLRRVGSIADAKALESIGTSFDELGCERSGDKSTGSARNRLGGGDCIRFRCRACCPLSLPSCKTLSNNGCGILSAPMIEAEDSSRGWLFSEASNIAQNFTARTGRLACEVPLEKEVVNTRQNSSIVGPSSLLALCKRNLQDCVSSRYFVNLDFHFLSDDPFINRSLAQANSFSLQSNCARPTIEETMAHTHTHTLSRHRGAKPKWPKLEVGVKRT